MKNHYEILEIDPTASSEEIDKAYNNLSKQFHPDNNGGVKYFDDLFVEIKNAYQILSKEELRSTYDREKGFIQKDDKEIDLVHEEPEILLFEVDKKVFEEGDDIKLTWQTKNADKVIITPFGEVDTSGSKIYRLKNYQKESLILTINITNSETGETAKRSLTLNSKITEFDFAEIEDTEKQKSTREKEFQIEPEEQSNSFEGTSAANSLNDFKTETFFSIKGRLRRSTYIGRAILLSLPVILLSLIAESSNDESLYTVIGFLVIICSILIFIQFIKRLHDINLSGWWGLLNLIPYIGGIFGLIVIFIDSNRGPNKYGDDPKGRI